TLDLRARRLRAQAHDGTRRTHARLGLEHSREISRAHAGLRRKFLDGKTLAQIAAHVVEQRREAAIRALELEQCRELRLAPRPAVVDDELLRDLARDGFAEVFGDQREREVDT